MDARKRACISRMPHTLIVQLKRFEFDYDSMVKLKLYDECAFPETIDLAPYAARRRRGTTGGGGAAKGAGADEGGTEGGETEGGGAEAGDEQASGNEDESGSTVYRLVGVTIHIGDGEFGHYYSYVRERTAGRSAAVTTGTGTGAGTGALSEDGRWLEFNDSIVREVDAAEVRALAGGGAGAMLSAATATPYILFYESVAAAPVRGEPAGAARGRGRGNGGVDPQAATGVGGGAWAVEIVAEDNRVLRRQSQVFHPCHVAFTERLLAEQVEAWRAQEVSLPDVVHAIIHGAEFALGTLARAYHDRAYTPLQVRATTAPHT